MTNLDFSRLQFSKIFPLTATILSPRWSFFFILLFVSSMKTPSSDFLRLILSDKYSSFDMETQAIFLAVSVSKLFVSFLLRVVVPIVMTGPWRGARGTDFCVASAFTLGLVEIRVFFGMFSFSKSS